MTAPSVLPADAPAVDIATLIALVAEIERSQRHEDVEGFLGLFDSSAVWVNGAGRRLIGLDEISVFTRSVLPGAMANSSVGYTVEHIAFLTPDVALTGVAQQYTDLDGKPQGGTGAPTYIWRRTQTSWKLVAGQNTTVLG
ncbi:SgcJ/EcaC family oxidoreductase [Winogradskya consettensis]|uniref:DUF4440 domain-containing protein n=1 Tax=Winogradskya consettensis TaxID=113560 RepID=A0A919SD66_9ACTN|nr:SgcJ/EcaC family oxidoreductase [Actinoplanes consettensis]GIM70237.1 hypothetical protein Aco04nite_19210 [Actinoplanes consettensis]